MTDHSEIGGSGIGMEQMAKPTTAVFQNVDFVCSFPGCPFFDRQLGL